MDVRPKAKGASAALAPPLKPKLSHDTVDAARQKRASRAQRHEHVERFKPHAISASQQPGPKHTSPSHSASSNPLLQPTTSGDDDDSNSIFDEALASATSHEQPRAGLPLGQRLKYFARRHRRSVGTTASIIVVLAFAGVIAFQNRLHLQLQLASIHAGFSATLPNYHPDNYHVGSLHHNAGSIDVSFVSPTRPSYDFVQKQSNWNSQTLLENYVATSSRHHQTYERGGQTIYLYGNGNATWVDAGIWYQLHTKNQSLSNDQLLAIASSTS